MKIHLRIVLALAGILCAALPASAQRTISGNVKDTDGYEVIGAGVFQEGTNNGTVTDLDGNFVLTVPDGAEITVSSIGYKTVTFTVDSRTEYTIVLESDSEALEGVEIVAYGVQQRVSVTGSLSSVKSEDIVRTPVSSVGNVLAGQLSGVTTVQYSGEPGSDAATIFVRGKGTWSDSSPLIQVDGVERSMSDINPEDIESITVLKDASATAVFGVRGANGVILVTTKRGAQGKATVNVNTSFSILTPTALVEQAGSYDYAMFYNQMRLNDGSPEVFSPEVIEKFRTNSDPIRFPSTRWTDYMMKDMTTQQNHSVNISGGTDRVRYFVSAGFMNQGGLFEEFGSPYHFGYQYQRFNYRANLDLDVTNTTKISFNVAGVVSDADKPRTGQGSTGMLRNIYYATPFSSPGLVDGKLVTTTTDYSDGVTLPFTGTNGLEYYSIGGFISTTINKLQMDLALEQELDFITKGLLFKVKGSYNTQYSSVMTGTADRATYQPVIQPDGSLLYRKSGENTPISYDDSMSKARDWYFEASLNYNRTFGDHSVTGLVLYNQSKEYYPSSYSDIPRGYVGLVGRATYDYKKRYLLEFNIGYNGSENFHPDRRFGVFPAGSVGWVVSDEPFFEPIKSVVSFFKLRASWGLVGNDKIGGSRFMYLADPYIVNNSSLATRSGWAYNFGVDNSTNHLGSYENARNNPNVSWEKAFKQNYGVDANFLGERLQASFDYYLEHRTDILLRNLTAPGIIGFDVPYANLGAVDSWGWEASLKWADRTGQNFNYWVNVNVSHNQNKVLEKYEQPYSNDYQYEKGNRIGARYMYQFFEFYNEDTPRRYEETFGQPFPQQLVELKDGDAVFVDLDGNGIIDGNDKTRQLGFTDDPEYVLGLNAGFNWKNFEFNMQWTGAWGVTRMLGESFRMPFRSRTDYTTGGLLQYIVDNSWDPDNPSQDAEYPRATWTNGQVNNYQDCALYEKDASYLRLKTLMIAYNFDFPFFERLGISRAQLAFSGYNLLTFTPYIWGDPETTASTDPTYPLQRTYTLSLKLNF
ncbi:MAG TPA: TonB-dependent receptor [Candidatus Cryptobacteroides merdipullorum]|uniref:TonB-dependent receptor n=1 Tax=Candidatus Cryptobacteroides merdipullorum TaxID=2840771 RepID=A0A9D1KHQ5_9BACT|nr:TonB-dependent receptor [Candidatus Cryptobacteroides merdipullorum]